MILICYFCIAFLIFFKYLELGMYRIVTATLFLCLFSLIDCYSQTDLSLPFLVASPDARCSGMGDAGTAVANDIYATYWNPAGLGFLKNTKIPGSKINGKSRDNLVQYFEGAYSRYNLPLYNASNIGGWNLVAGTYFKPFKGTIVLDFNFANLDDMYRTSENGQTLGKFSASEYCLGVAYGISINENWAFGVKAKKIGSYLAPSSRAEDVNGSAFAFDLGALWNPELNLDSNSMLGNKCLSVGINLQNLGPAFNYRMKSEPLPTSLRLGLALKLNQKSERKLTLALDAVKHLIKRDSVGSDPLPKSLVSSWDNPFDLSFGLGFEYWFMRNLALRAGYYTEPPNVGNRNYMTMGGSLRIYIFQVDCSYYLSTGDTKYLTNILKFTARVGG